MKNLDQRIKKLLESRGIKTEKEIEEFFNPSISLLQPLNDYPEFKKATARIVQAIEQNEKVIIYGDYDTDGVSASAILSKFLKSRGTEPVVIIPNRFNDGYGLNQSSLEQIVDQHLPDLFITVDCGITSVAEIEFLNEIGIDTIITDHHLPSNELPQALAVIDAKIEQHKYPYCDYCGAGIVLKLVQALGANIMDYIDIAAIATIADIVPLTGENRVIAAVGLSKINSPSCNEGIKAIKRFFTGGETLTSQDVSFRIVPRINSTGRMKDAYLSFELLVAESKQQAEQIADQIEQINSDRVSLIASSMEKINKMLSQTDLANQNFVVATSKDFHEGILGILASKLVSDYQMPGFVFCEQDNGFLKGSCRSPENIDIHKILLSMSDLFENFGGHSQAAGITIKKQNFKQFLAQLNKALESQPKQQKEHFDFEVEESDINLNFASQIQQLEPTGCGNPKPILKLKVGDCEFKKTSNPKHFQLITKNKKYFICFNGKQYQTTILSGNAEIYFTLGTEIYNNNFRLKTSLISISANSIESIGEDKELALVSDAFGSISATKDIEFLPDFKSLLVAVKELCKKSGTIVVARTKEELSAAKSELGLNCYYCVPSNQESCIWYCPGAIYQSDNLSKYNSIVILSGSLMPRTTHNAKVYSFKTTPSTIKADKKIFADCYRVFASQKIAPQNDICEYVQEVSKYLPYSCAQIAFAVSVFAELGLVQTSDQNCNFCLSVVPQSQKRELTSSKLFCMVQSDTI